MRHVNPSFNISVREQRDLAKAWILTSLAFAVFFLRTGWVSPRGLDLTGFATVFGIAALTAGVGFIVHELCHKLAAHHFRVHGEFHSNGMMLVISVVIAFMGVLFVAPGAVHMRGSVSRRENGLIAAAGPASNMVLVLLFLPLVFLDHSLLAAIGRFGILINAILGAFNMIPFMGLDGSKILAWHKPIYFGMCVVAAVLVVGAYTI